MTAKVMPSPDQGALFEQSPFSTRVEIPLDPTTQSPDPFIGMHEEPAAEIDGPVVNLIDRAEQLHIVTEKLAQINRTRGLAEVLETAQGRRIQKRYDGDANHILHKAEAIHDSRMRDAKRAFAHASGMWAMVESGMATKDEARAATQDMWKDFLRKYADANQPNRLALRKQQTKLVKTLTKPPKK